MALKSRSTADRLTAHFAFDGANRQDPMHSVASKCSGWESANRSAPASMAQFNERHEFNGPVNDLCHASMAWVWAINHSAICGAEPPIQSVNCSNMLSIAAGGSFYLVFDITYNYIRITAATKFCCPLGWDGRACMIPVNGEWVQYNVDILFQVTFSIRSKCRIEAIS